VDAKIQHVGLKGRYTDERRGNKGQYTRQFYRNDISYDALFSIRLLQLYWSKEIK